MAKQKDINLVVVTAERQVLDQTVDSVVFAAHDGELGVLTDRAPLMCELGIGQLRYEKGGQRQRMFIDGGFAQVNDNTVTVLAGDAIAVEDITQEMVAEAEKAAGEIDGYDAEAVDARQAAQRRASVMRALRVAV